MQKYTYSRQTTRKRCILIPFFFSRQKDSYDLEFIYTRGSPDLLMLVHFQSFHFFFK